MTYKGLLLNTLLLMQFSAVTSGNDNMMHVQQLKNEHLKKQNELFEHDKMIAEKKKLIQSVTSKVRAFFEKQVDSLKFNKQEKEEFKEEIGVYRMLFEEILRAIIADREELLETLIERHEELQRELLKIDNELDHLQNR